MSGVVVSPSLKGLLRKLNSLVEERPTSISNLKGEIKHIVATLQTLAAAAEDAEEQAIGNKGAKEAKVWLESLQKVLYLVDDLIDELQIEMSSNDDKDQNQVSSSLSRFFKSTSPPKSRFAALLQSIRESLQDVAIHGTPFPITTSVHKRTADVYRHRSEDEFIQDPEEIIGRRGDEKEVINLILNSAQGVSVVPIVGFIGIGKTTLARLIYCNKRLYGNYFDRKLWLWVGDVREQMDFWTVLSDELIRNDSLKGDGRDIKQLKMKLQKLLENKRFFIVLDGFKDNNLHKSLARELIDMLSKGSSILLTTRSRRAASLIATTPAYRLQPLSPDASYQLFTQFAFTMEDSECTRIRREFVKLCSGVPLLLKSIRSLLSGKNTPTEWRSCLEDVQDHKEDVMLYDAFFEIPSHLKLPIQCFRLQKACGLGIEALMCVWMALGFLYSDDTTQPPEYIARKYLKEFVESALCPDVEYAPGGVVRHIDFNDALCDFATAIGHLSWVIVRDEKKFYGSPVYMIWDQDCSRGTVVPKVCTGDPGIVRLFMVSTRQRASVQFVRDIVSCFPHLRVLGVGGCDVEMLPDSIGQLKHLRYLDAGRNPGMKSLPDSICDLWHLQTLCLHGCSQLVELPANIGRLHNLRHLTVTILKESLPEAIGQLTSLRTLGLTNCPRLSSLPSTIKNLKNLETLAIVSCPELDLAASSSVEGFKGLDAIHTLLLSHLPKFAGFRSDLGNPSVALKHLQILFCTSLTDTKWITQFRSLRSLTIEVCPQLLDLKLIDGAYQFDGLLELVIRRCPRLGCTTWIKQFVSLRSLVIDACHKLVDLDSGFSELKNLERLEIRRCPGLTKWFASPAGKNWRQIAHVRTFVGMFLMP